MARASVPSHSGSGSALGDISSSGGRPFYDQPLAERTIITFFIIEVLPFEKQSCLPDNPSRYSVLLADHLILTIHGYEPALRVAAYNELHSTHPLLCAVEAVALRPPISAKSLSE